MGPFNSADWIIVFAYLAAIIGLGAWVGRGQTSVRDYFLGSQNISWWGVGFSIVAAETSALTIISIPALAFGSDFAFIQMVLGYALGRFALAAWVVPSYFKSTIYSPYALFERAFGSQARRASALLFLVTEVLAAGVRVYAASIPLKLILGDSLHAGGADPILIAIVCFVFLSLTYTYFGGVKAVIWTDAVQFVLFLFGGLFTIFFIVRHFPGGTHELFTLASQKGKLHWLDPVFRLSGTTNIWMGLIGGLFVTLSSHGAEQLVVQRILVCKNAREGRKAMVLTAALIVPLFLVFLAIGTCLWAYYQSTPMKIPLPEARPGLKANDYVFPIFIVSELPHGLRAFLVVGILSAAMSSISSALTSLASVSTIDLLRHWIGGRDDRFQLRVSRISTVVWAAILAGVAYVTRDSDYVVNAAYSIRGLTSGALLGGLFLAITRATNRGGMVIASMCGSFGLMCWISRATVLQAGVSIPRISWPWYTLIGTAATILIALVLKGILPEKKTGEAVVQPRQ